MYENIISQLAASGISATMEFNADIAVQISDSAQLIFGTANDAWGGSEWKIEGGEWQPGDEYVESDVPSDSTDAAEIAKAIMLMFNEYKSIH